MKVGDRVDGRWEVVGEAPGEPSVGRWRAIDGGTGEPAEILALQPPSTHARSEHGKFLDLHRDLSRARDPALVRVHGVGWTAREAWVARTPLEDPTLSDLSGPLPPGVVAAIGARLMPAVLAAGGATRSALTPRDIGLDASGQPVLAPRGRPGDRVDVEQARHVAPEAFAGAPADAASGLYGLGVVLYRLAAGRDPVPGAAGGTPVPAGNWVAGLPPVLDRALQLLLSKDPSARASALPLLEEVGTEIPDLRRLVRAATPQPATLDPGIVKVTTRAQGGVVHARPDVPHPRSAVVVPTRALQALDPDEASAAAGAADLPIAVLEDLAKRELPLVLAVHRSRRGAAADTTQPALPDAVPVATTARPSLGWPFLLVVVGALLVVGAGAAVLLSSTALWAVTGILLLAEVALGLQWRHLGNQWADVESGWRLLRDRPMPTEALRNRWQRVAALRRRMAGSGLPDAAEADVRGALREIERHLEELGRIAATVREALDAVDAAALRARVAALTARTDAAAVTERDRLARTLADVEAIQARRERVEAQLVRIDDALDDLDAVLGEVGTREGRGARGVEALRKTTRLARESLSETPPRPRPREKEPS